MRINRTDKIYKYIFCPILAIGTTVSTGAISSELLHQFTNPSFGGNPGNSAHLLGLAGAQNQFQGDGGNDTTPLEEFNERLQRSLLGRITSAITGDIVDADGNITPGTFETLDYTINVIDEGNGLITIETIDKISGDLTVIQVQNDVAP